MFVLKKDSNFRVDNVDISAGVVNLTGWVDFERYGEVIDMIVTLIHGKIAQIAFISDGITIGMEFTYDYKGGLMEIYSNDDERELYLKDLEDELYASKLYECVTEEIFA